MDDKNIRRRSPHLTYIWSRWRLARLMPRWYSPRPCKMLPTEVAKEVVRPALVGTCFCFILVAVEAKSSTAEEVVGRRQFSDQLVIPEPFVEDELAFPSILHIVRPRRPDEPRTRATQLGAEIKKRLTADFELSLGGSLLELSPDGKPTTTGFGNLEVGLKYQFLRDPDRKGTRLNSIQ